MRKFESRLKITMIHKNGLRSGITLLEILMAIAIFSFSIIPIIMMYRYTTQANMKSVNAMHAANLAIQKIEELKFGGIRTPNNPMSDVKKWGEFERLYQLLKEETDTGNGWSPFQPNWKIFERSEGWDTIPGFPNFKRYTRVSFYPLETPDPSKIPENAISDEYARLISRIQILVEVRWVEYKYERDNQMKEMKYTMYTIVTNKKY